jgi:hypothetical protein
MHDLLHSTIGSVMMFNQWPSSTYVHASIWLL